MTVTTMIGGLVGSTSLPIYELDRAHVEASRKKVRPFDPQRGFSGDPKCPAVPTSPNQLALTTWRLAHAVKKADCLRPTLHRWAAYFGFFLEQLAVLDWRHSDLRLLTGASGVHADFYGTALAGRIGQGVALLLMEQNGYTFVSHYPRQSGAQGPDFIVEKFTPAALTRALVESKGAFGRPQERTAVKEALRDGLKQLKGAPAHGASKSFVVGTFIREYGDGHTEPSLIAFVDPDDDGGTSALPEDWVRRHNYAAWLDAMNLHYSASDLRSIPRDRTPRPTRMLSLRFNGLEFAAIVLGALTPSWHEPEVLTRGILGATHGLVAGLPINTLKMIGDVLQRPGASLPAPDETAGEAWSATRATQEVRPSILSDGSLFGPVPFEHLFDAPTVDLVL